MAMSGDPIDAATAMAWGLVNEVVPDDELDEATAAMVARVTRGSARSKGVGKRTFYDQIGLDQDSAYDVAIEVMATQSLTADAQEGIAAFIEKRPPFW